MISLVFFEILVVKIIIFIFFFVNNFINLHNIIQKVIFTEYSSPLYWFWLLHFDNMWLGIIYYNWNLLDFYFFDLLNRLLNKIIHLSSNQVIYLGNFTNDIFFLQSKGFDIWAYFIILTLLNETLISQYISDLIIL